MRATRAGSATTRTAPRRADVPSMRPQPRSESRAVLPLSPEFGPFLGRIWMNCAHQGPLPRGAREAALAAVEMKFRPAGLADELFVDVPARLRVALASLVGGAPEQVALTNSTSYGFDILARGLQWTPGD